MHIFAIFRWFLRFFGFYFWIYLYKGVKKTAREDLGHYWIILERENRGDLRFSLGERNDKGDHNRA
jgi:hypothetical protein